MKRFLMMFVLMVSMVAIPTLSIAADEVKAPVAVTAPAASPAPVVEALPEAAPVAAVAPPVSDVGYETLLKQLVESLGGIKGASTLAIIALLIQLLALALRTPLGKYAGKYKLLAIYLLSTVGGVLGLKLAGVDWAAALVHSQTLAYGQVFFHQAWKQFVEKAAEKPA